MSARTPTQAGAAGEARAAAFIAAHGLRIVARNYRTRAGEIDLVADDAGTLVFVEVRARASSTHGTPFDTVHAHKQARLVRAAAHYVQAHHPYAPPPCRFDVIGITGPGDGAIEWRRGAFSAS